MQALFWLGGAFLFSHQKKVLDVFFRSGYVYQLIFYGICFIFYGN
jgi:hypothetical protein